MEEVVEVHLPVPLGVDIGGQVHAGKLAGEALLTILGDHLLVMVIGAHGITTQVVEDALGFVPGEALAPALVVGGGLGGEVFGAGDVEFTVEDRVAGGVFVHVGGAVTDPLAGDEDGEFDVELDLAHLEGRRVPVAHEVADQALVIGDGLGALAIADAGGLGDGGVVAHVVDDADEAVIENGVDGVEVLLHPRACGAAGLVGGGTKLLDFLLRGLGGVVFHVHACLRDSLISTS